MHYSRLHLFCLFAVSFVSVVMGYSPQLAVNEFLKNGALSDSKKINAVTVKKKDPRALSLLKRSGAMIGLSALFEWSIPKRWKKIFGFRRDSVVNFLSVLVAVTNATVIAYLVFRGGSLMLENAGPFNFFAIKQPVLPALAAAPSPITQNSIVAAVPLPVQAASAAQPVVKPLKPLPSTPVGSGVLNEFE